MFSFFLSFFLLSSDWEPDGFYIGSSERGMLLGGPLSALAPSLRLRPFMLGCLLRRDVKVCGG